ncbi:MAG: GMC oxidoreductase, partial [Novosphingobium sp.]
AVGYSQLTIRNGRRVSAYEAFVRPVRHRTNLTIVTGAMVERVNVEQGRATGVVLRRNGAIEIAEAHREVILCAGVIGSPKLLQLSGIGPADHLSSLGIPVIVDRGTVGANLSEHKGVWLEYRLRGQHSHNRELRGWRLGANALRYFTCHSGPLARSVDLNGFIRSDPAVLRADAQIQFWALTARKDATTLEPECFPAVSAGGWGLRPTSRGSIMIRSADPADNPVIRPSFLATGEDRAVLVRTFRRLREIMAQPALAGFLAEEVVPGSHVMTDEEVIEASLTGENGYHATGTCRMGSDIGAVVDSRLNVRGVRGLRIVDCSVMPTQVSSGVNGPVMALAWHAASLIAADRPQ